MKLSAADFVLTPPVWVVDPQGAYSSNSFLQNITSTKSFITNQFCNAADNICIEGDYDGANAGAGHDPAYSIPINGAWHHLAVSAKLNAANVSKVYQIYVDGAALPVSVTYRGNSADTLTFNGLEFCAFSDGYGQSLTGDIADFWFAPGQFVDWSVPGNLAKVIAAGKPVDLGANGELVTGTAPAILFSGDHTGFAANKGTGGAFTLTGTLTDASSSPST